MEMRTRGWIAAIIISICVSGLTGYMIRGPGTTMSLAYGFQEDKDVWNRIRVNSNGYVICAPIEQVK